MSQSLSAQVTRPPLRYLAVAASIGLQIAINRANTFFSTSDSIGRDDFGNFILAGKWPNTIDSINEAVEFKIVVDNTGTILELQQVAKNKDVKTNQNCIDSRTLAVLLSAWADEQIEKLSPDLFTEPKILNERKIA